jgi:hypothetical protein
MRVYKFLSCKYGLRALREQRLKISEVRSLNDPFELLPFDLSDPEHRKWVFASRDEIGRNHGLLCFSRHWHNPVLWAHYAESHKGLCLGFDVPDGQQAVEYVKGPVQLTHVGPFVSPDIANKMLFTKYEHWQYEEEIRLWAKLDQKSGDYYFHDFDDDLQLKEVIAGAGNRVSEGKIVKALGTNVNGIRILKARLAFNAFRVVEDETGFAGGPATQSG